eukprot:3999247-Amphidinium_carterae.1
MKSPPALFGEVTATKPQIFPSKFLPETVREIEKKSSLGGSNSRPLSEGSCDQMKGLAFALDTAATIGEGA